MNQVPSGDSLLGPLVRRPPPWVEILALSSLAQDGKPFKG